MAKWCPITKSYVVYLVCQDRNVNISTGVSSIYTTDLECEYKNKNCKKDKNENKKGK